MAELFQSGRLIDLILGLVVVEAAALLLYWRNTGRGTPPRELLPTLCAGAFLLLALRFTLAGSHWILSAACLAAAGLAHVADIFQRWRK